MYKEIAWKTFNDRSSAKGSGVNIEYEQLSFNLQTGEPTVERKHDSLCYSIKDIADYIQREFKGKDNVPKDDVIDYIYDHPIFPTRNYKSKIWDALKKYYGAEIHKQTISFTDRSF